MKFNSQGRAELPLCPFSPSASVARLTESGRGNPAGQNIAALVLAEIWAARQRRPTKIGRAELPLCPFSPSASVARLTESGRATPQARTSLRLFWRKFGRRGSAALPLLVTMVLFFAAGAMAETTNTLSGAEIEGRQLAQKILEQWPATNSTVTGVLKIRDAKGNRTNYSVKCEVLLQPASWTSRYTSDSIKPWTEEFLVTHAANSPNVYVHFRASTISRMVLPADETAPFAGSDFWLGDLGLEFFHWPQQKILKKEFHNNTPSVVLESRNPHPATNGYARVVSRIEEEGGGVMEAQTYDVANRQLKDFRVKNLKKINGQWQVELVIMKNLQTGSTTRLEFDLKK